MGRNGNTDYPGFGKADDYRGKAPVVIGCSFAEIGAATYQLWKIAHCRDVGDLYREERFRRPMEDIVDDMRRRDLRIGPLGVAGLGLTAFQISFEYADRDKAQADR